MSLSTKTPLLKDRRITDDDGEEGEDPEQGQPSHQQQQQQQRGADYGSTTRTAAQLHGDDDEEDDGGSVYVYSYPTHLQPGNFTSLEKLCFFLSSFLFVLLCLFVGLYARNAIQKRPDDNNGSKPNIPSPTATPGVPPSPPNNNDTHTKSYCLQSNCIITAAQILQDVDQERDPCEDFYAYTCSRWQENHMIPETRNRIDRSSTTLDTIRHRLDRILTDRRRGSHISASSCSSSSSITLETAQHEAESLGEKQHHDPSNSSSITTLPNPTDVLDHQLFKKLSDFYRSCMNQEKVEQRGVEPLYALLRVVRDFIPLTATTIDGQTLASVENATTTTISNDAVDNQQRQQALVYLSERDVWPLFTISPPLTIVQQPQRWPREIHKYQLEPGQTGLPSTKVYENEELMAAYMQTVTSLLDAIFQQDTANEFGFKTWSTIATARRIIEFEKNIMRATTIVTDADTTTDTALWWTLDELQQKIPEIEWSFFFPPPVSKHQHNQILINIPSTQFVDHLKGQVLSNRNSRTIQMYFMWRTIWRYVDSLGEGYLTHKRKWMALLEGRVENVKAVPERRDTCLALVDQRSSAMGVLLGRYYVLDHLKAIKLAKIDLETIAQRWIKDIFIVKVPYLPWALSREEQAEVVEKLQRIQFEIGYPSPQTTWSDNDDDSVNSDEPMSVLFDVLYLSEYFGDLQVDSDDLFGNVVRSNIHKIKKEKSRQQRHNNNAVLAWKVDAHSVDIYYEKETNKVIVPAGLLQLPYFDPNGPYYLYLGSIGWMIGHEIMHEFDSLITQQKSMAGSKFNRTIIDECLINQYNELHVNGVSTLNENFADNGGFSLIQHYFDSKENGEKKKGVVLGHAKDEEFVPGIDHWTSEQIAYIQFGRMRCSKALPTSGIRHDSWKTAPDRLRVNGPIMNSYHFAKTFSCKKGSQMHPDTHARPKCGVW